MAELDVRISAILRKLQLLSETKAALVASSSAHTKPDTKAPPGVDWKGLGGKRDRPPPKDRSLFDWYSWAFDRAEDDYRRRLLCYLAERDYENAVHRAPDRRRGDDEWNRGEVEDEQTWRGRVVEWYEGRDVLEVALLEQCSTGAIAKARAKHGRSEKDGRPRSPVDWENTSDVARRAICRRLKESNMTIRDAALHVGAPKSTVADYWPRSTRARAA